jgi:hypothetical protein
MSKPAALIAAVVAAAVAAAVFGATAAVRLIGSGAFGPGGRPLSEADVRRSLDAAPGTQAARPSSARPVRSQPKSPHPSRKSGAFSSAGGSVYASCTSGQATLSRWIPAGGYGTDGYVYGPASSAWVKFTSGSSAVTVTVTCVSGNPHFVASGAVASPDDRGGGHGGDGGHGDGGGAGPGQGSGN